LFATAQGPQNRPTFLTRPIHARQPGALAPNPGFPFRFATRRNRRIRATCNCRHGRGRTAFLRFGQPRGCRRLREADPVIRDIVYNRALTHETGHVHGGVRIEPQYGVAQRDIASLRSRLEA